jgi:Flp pilus assembly protein TadG
MTVKLMKLALSGWLVALRWSAVRLGRDKRGNAAIEFAVIVPVMLTMFFGVVEFSSAVAVKRKISMAAEELADLAARYKEVPDTEIDNFFKIARAVITPYSTTVLKATITEIYIDPATGLGRAQWSKGDVVRLSGSTVPVPANLIARDDLNNILAGQYLIFAETSYVYVPAVGYVMAKAGVPLTDMSYMRPRLSTCVFYPATPNPATCPTS